MEDKIKREELKKKIEDINKYLNLYEISNLVSDATNDELERILDYLKRYGRIIRRLPEE